MNEMPLILAKQNCLVNKDDPNGKAPLSVLLQSSDQRLGVIRNGLSTVL